MVDEMNAKITIKAVPGNGCCEGCCFEDCLDCFDTSIALVNAGLPDCGAGTFIYVTDSTEERKA
jgi:hypothetical protein